MNTAQRVVRRSTLLSRLLIAVVGVSALLLVHAVVRDNLSDGLAAHWPWKLRLLDVQSATAMVLATGGAALARAQYARTVRPALGGNGQVVADLAPGGRLAWTFHLTNAAQDVAVVTEIAYALLLTPTDPAEAPATPVWTHHAEVDRRLRERGLAYNADYLVALVGVGRPLPPQSLTFLGWFTERAMTEIVELYVRIRVVDRVGDVHERILPCLRGADRTPRNPSPQLS
ncbi:MULTISPECIES: hypothetical protein [Kitasatospora]|uniref:Uncharacterized protein n=2 Tax=Kitasatospora TaxID=2063 RepID=A0ABT1J619_9ACTN|nr:hypothetical protein [Kitasatospora paracochleata]MCP2312679.1 hypothetical protein [Kitasatospora paracochleata]